MFQIRDMVRENTFESWEIGESQNDDEKSRTTHFGHFRVSVSRKWEIFYQKTLV